MAGLDEKDLQLYGIIYALSSDISDMYSYHIKTDKVTAFRMAGAATGVEEGLKLGLGYTELMKIYIKNNVCPTVQEEMLEATRIEKIIRQLREKDTIFFHYKLNRNGETHYYYLKCVRIGNPEDFDQIIFAFVQEDADVSRKQMLDALEHDELTGVYTRQAFYHHAKELLDANPEDSYDLLMADAANFKMVNSVYGETRGDEALCFLAGYLSEQIENGIVGRYGGDKFVGLVKSPLNSQKEWVEKMIDGVPIASPIPNLEIKCGIYSNVDRSLTISAMCDRVLLAVKSIKHNYTLPYANYDGPVSKKHLQSQMFESQFKQALHNREFVVWYQPKYDAETEELIGAEALVRWQMPDGSFVSPGEFIPTFEEDGLIIKLDEYVFRRVCENIRNWMDEGLYIFPISVNLSRASLYYENTLGRYKQILVETGVPAEYVPIELTESAAIQSNQITNLMVGLKDAGFQLHMDDFGSGESSLASFNMLPFDVVKLDKTLVDFIGDMGGDELLKHIIELAHFKQMKVIAEGVEQRCQLQFLKKMSCDEIQGFYFSSPKPQEEIVKCFKEAGEKMRKEQRMSEA